MALGGLTPSEAWGIEIEGQNKWITLIQNSALINRPIHERSKDFGVDVHLNHTKYE